MQIFRPADGEVPSSLDRKILDAVRKTDNEEELNNVYNSYIQQWSEQAAEIRIAEEEGSVQAENATVLQELLLTKEQQEEEDRKNKARLILLQSRNLEKEAERVLEEEIEQTFVAEKYKYADELNKAIDGGKGTIVNVALLAIYTPVASKIGPDKPTMAKWQKYLQDLLEFDDNERGQIYSFESIKNQSEDFQRNVIRMFVYSFILNTIKEYKLLKVIKIEPENIKIASDAFNNLFDQTMKPVFERIGKIIEATKSYQALIEKIKESNRIAIEKAKEKVQA